MRETASRPSRIGWGQRCDRGGQSVYENPRPQLTYALPELTAAPPMIGMRLAESNRSNVQWYDPCDLCASNVGDASLTVPFSTAVDSESIKMESYNAAR